MSAIGTKRTNRPSLSWSAIVGKADIVSNHAMSNLVEIAMPTEAILEAARARHTVRD